MIPVASNCQEQPKLRRILLEQPLLSYRQIHYNIPNDLRSPVVLLVNALIATVVAFGFAVRSGSLKRWVNIHFCLSFGLWTAAIFRLVPPLLNEQVLFMKNVISPDVPYILLGAFIHGGIVFLLASPFAHRALNLPLLSNDITIHEMCGIVILVFFIFAVIVRLFAEPALMS